MESDKRIHVLTIKYKNDIKQQEVPLFRGAVNAAMGDDGNVLFHNHTDRNYRYSYPLIQYKRLGGKAAIVCVNEGADALLSQMYRLNTRCRLGDRNVEMEIAGVEPVTVGMENGQLVEYKLYRWLPLNGDNYTEYSKTKSLRERVMILERILKGNILSFAKGVGVTLDYDIRVDVTDILAQRMMMNKTTRLMAFDVSFITNVSLPNNVGLGKSASVGFGVVEKMGVCGQVAQKLHKHEDVDAQREDVPGLPEQKVEKPIFLLGGKDLEMNTIKNILQNHDCIVHDNELTWQNARLSAYADVVNEHTSSVIYGIELKPDIPLPDKYITIDHHNDNRQGPSALEQVAKVLGTKLSRFHQLVAANDKGYIPGMKSIDATDEEVFYIRYLDRRAQGVTEEEEDAAEADVAKAEKVGKLTVVTTGLKHFSPIVDRMYPYDRLLILAGDELTYYGEGIDMLREVLAPLCKDLYYGGCGEVGYLGIPQTTPDIYETTKQKIIELKRC